jgi:hypothetical protein
MRAPPGVKDDESGAKSHKSPRGKASLLLLLRERIGGYHARVSLPKSGLTPFNDFSNCSGDCG